MQTLIVQAISARHLLQLDYNGSTRIVEPHIYGVGPQGRERLCAYQLLGGSLSGEITGWKTFELAKAADIQLLVAHFKRARSEFDPCAISFQAVYRRV